MMLRKLKYGLSVFLVAVILLSRISCGKTGYAPISENRSENDTEIQNDSNYPEPEILTEITISAGDKQLDGVLFDNETAKLFAEMLPITAWVMSSNGGTSVKTMIFRLWGMCFG